MRLQTAKRFAGFSPAVAELLQGADFRKADIVFDKEQVIDLGGVRVRAIAMGFNHTRRRHGVLCRAGRDPRVGRRGHERAPGSRCGLAGSPPG